MFMIVPSQSVSAMNIMSGEYVIVNVNEVFICVKKENKKWIDHDMIMKATA